MKQIFYLSLLLFFLSCKKEVIKPVTEPEVVQTPQDTLDLNGEFLLVDGKMYINNLDDYSKFYYNHFDSIKHRSSLRFSGSIIPFETIIKDTTTWSFYMPKKIPSIGRFVINNDTLNPLGLNVTNNYLTVVESPTAITGSQQLNGSARPLYIELYNAKEKLIKIYVQECYFSDGVYNYKSFNVLTFKKIKSW